MAGSCVLWTMFMFDFRKEIGLEKFFKKSFLDSVRNKQLRTLVLEAFKEYEYVSTDVCMFKFFNLLSKYHRIDEDRFSFCAVGVCVGWVGACVCIRRNGCG